MITLDAPILPDYYMLSTCSRCGLENENPCFLRKSGLHVADVICINCGNKWYPPKEKNAKKRSGGHKKILKKFSHGFCEICLCPIEKLPKGETLEGHHTLEFRNDGPQVTRENAQIVCTRCHELIGLLRRHKARELGITYDMLIKDARIRGEIPTSGMGRHTDSTCREAAHNSGVAETPP
jgi:hypothetical protein